MAYNTTIRTGFGAGCDDHEQKDSSVVITSHEFAAAGGRVGAVGGFGTIGPNASLERRFHLAAGAGRTMLTALKNAFLRGLIVLIPLVLLWITIRELFQALVMVAEPIADLFPAGIFESVDAPEFISAILVVVTALLLGILAAVPPIRRLGSWLERNTVLRLPLYRMIKTFISAFLEMEDTRAFRPAMIVDDEGGAEPCYVIEESEDRPNVVVLVPWSPASFAGSVKLVPRKRVVRLDLSLDEFSLSLANFGLGMYTMLPKHPDDQRPPQS